MKDNIILITTDQQRFDTIQALGNKNIFTPHLNYLVTQGISYTRCYADCPICVPSRTTIMTGKKGYESGVVSNANHQNFMENMTNQRKTLPAILTDNGYQTKAMGKMHFEPARACYGFESMRLPLDYMREYDKKSSVSRPKSHGVGECEIEPVISTVDIKDSITTWTVDGSIDFIETRDPLRPFFLWTSFTKPHPPFDPCKDFWDLYQNISMPDAVYGDWSKDIDNVPMGLIEGAFENTNVHLFSEEQLKASKRAYYAMITQLDYSLGLLFGCLRENNLFENTWIIFTSDHGEMLGDHHMAQKNLFLEGASHIPMIIVPPKNSNYKRNEIKAYLAEINDVYPTILAMANIEKPENITGKNLLELDEERIFYGNSLNKHFCIIKDNIKLIYCSRGDVKLLFDLNEDKMEQHNLINDKNYKHIKEELWKLLIEHTKKHTPDLLENDYFITSEPPKNFKDIQNRWFGFHFKDYNVDTFH